MLKSKFKGVIKNKFKGINDVVFATIFGGISVMVVKELKWFLSFLGGTLILGWAFCAFMIANVLVGSLPTYFNLSTFYLLLESCSFGYLFYYLRGLKNRLLKALTIVLTFFSGVAFLIDANIAPAYQPTGFWFTLFWTAFCSLMVPTIIYMEWQKWIS